MRCQHIRMYSWIPWSKKDKRKSELAELLEEPGIESTVESKPVPDSLQEEIDIKRNKSRLQEGHRRILNGMRPYDKSMEWYHDTVKYKKRMLGRYGLNAMDVTAGVAWPTPAEIEVQKEYIRVAYPHSLHESWAKIKKDNEEKEARIRERDEKIAENAKHAHEWITKLHIRLSEKERMEQEARAEKARVIAEVRKQFSFQISVTDQRFIQALELYEKTEKKKKKAAKKEAREIKVMEQLGLNPQKKSQKKTEKTQETDEAE